MAAELDTDEAARAWASRFTTCPFCEAMCGLEVRVRDGEVVAIRGDEADPFSRGHVCPKAVALQDVHADPDRLRQPVRRTADGWQTIGWDEALDEAARRLREVQSAHGRDAVALYLGNPTVHSYGASLGSLRLARVLRTRHRYSATSVDQLPHHLVAAAMYGHQLLIPVPDIDRTQFFLVLGANPLASHGSLMTAPGVGRRLKALRARGGRLVVIDPRRTETAAVADQHLAIRPGADALLLLALLHVICAESLAKPGRLRAFADGWEEIERLVAAFPPERVAVATGLDADTIRQLARDFATAESAVCYGRFGVSTQEFGALGQWLIQLMNAVTGNLDRVGGAMWTKPAVDIVALTARLGQFGHPGKRKTRVRGLPSFGGELPVATLAEEMATPGPGQIRALITAAGNPVLSTPNGGQLERALPALDFMLAVDFYVNETTRHAHLILPPTFALERDHYDLVFHSLAVRNTAKYAPAVFPKADDQRHDFEIFSGLASRMATPDPGVTDRAARWLAERLTPRRLLALALRFGPWGAGVNPLSAGLTLASLETSPHGVDLGPLEPCLSARLSTKDRRIALTPPSLVADLARLEARFWPRGGRQAAEPDASPAEAGGLALIGRRHVRSCNSWLHNSSRLVKGPERCTLMLHPDDAAARGVADGERVSVRSRVGRVEAVAEVTPDIRPGVVSLPHGWGHDRPGIRLPVAAAHAGASINDLTDELLVDELSGNAAFSGVAVWVESLAT